MEEEKDVEVPEGSLVMRIKVEPIEETEEKEV